jgi:hypothetical protein
MLHKVKSYKKDLETFKINPHIKKHKKDWFKLRLIEDGLNLIKGLIALPFFILTLPFILVQIICGLIQASINLLFKGILIVTGLAYVTNKVSYKKTTLLTTLLKEINDAKQEAEKPKKKRASSSKKAKKKTTKKKSKSK